MASNNQALAETDQLTKIRKQLEFYFSEMYIRYDERMNKLMTENGRVRRNIYVPLSELLDFPEIKQWEVSEEQAKEAIAQSSHLVLSEAGDSVQRSQRPPPYELISHSILAYNFPDPIPSKEWFERAFSRFGRVYASNLCKYLESGLPKGKIYIDFADEEAAHNCSNYFLGAAYKLISKDKFELNEYVINKEELCEEEVQYYESQQGLFTYIDRQITDAVNQGKFDPEKFKEWEAELKKNPLPDNEEEWFNNLRAISKADFDKFHRESGFFIERANRRPWRANKFENRRPRFQNGNRSENESNEQRPPRRRSENQDGNQKFGKQNNKARYSVDMLRQSILPDSVVKVTLFEQHQNTRIGQLKQLVRNEFSNAEIVRENILYLDMIGDNRTNPNIYIRCSSSEVAEKVSEALKENIGETNIITGQEQERYVNRSCRLLSKKYDYSNSSNYRGGRSFSRRPNRDSSFNFNKKNRNQSQQSESEQESNQPQQQPEQTQVDRPPREPRVHNYEPGCIVKLNFISPSAFPSPQGAGNAFKTKVRKLPYQTGIVYAGIDFGAHPADGPVEANELLFGYVRFDTAENAQNFLKQSELSSIGEAVILQGEEERDYVHQIMRIRERKNQNRGNRRFGQNSGRRPTHAVRRRPARRNNDSD